MPKLYINRRLAAEHTADPSQDPDAKRSVFHQVRSLGRDCWMEWEETPSEPGTGWIGGGGGVGGREKGGGGGREMGGGGKGIEGEGETGIVWGQRLAHFTP